MEDNTQALNTAPTVETKRDTVVVSSVIDVIRFGQSWVLCRCVDYRSGYEPAIFLCRHARKFYGNFELGITYKLKMNLRLGIDIKTKETCIEYWLIDLEQWSL